MALTCPIGFDVDKLRQDVGDTYTQVAENPDAEYHFHRGFDYAVSRLGYDAEELSAIPRDAVDRFAGVGNPLAIAEIQPGQTVLDIGCGAGTDLMLAARKVGPTGRVIGVDMTPAMRRVARDNATCAGVAEIVDIRDGIAEALPVEDSSIDVVISNGVLNLASDKVVAFSEVARVLEPGGRLMLADVVLEKALSLSARSDVDLWAA